MISSVFHFDDEYETVFESRLCSCNGKCEGYCNGMFSAGTRRRPMAEILKRHAERQRREEDDILVRADEIRRRRAPEQTDDQ